MAMIEINGEVVAQLPYASIRKVADLAYFDGPLLSLFRDDNHDNYIYYWYDADEICNRWLVFRLSEKQLANYIKQTLTLRDMITNPFGGHLYVVDIDGEGNQLNVLKTEPSYLSHDCLAQQGTYFDPSLSIFYEQEVCGESLVIVLEENQTLRRISQNYLPYNRILHFPTSAHKNNGVWHNFGDLTEANDTSYVSMKFIPKYRAYQSHTS